MIIRFAVVLTLMISCLETMDRLEAKGCPAWIMPLVAVIAACAVYEIQCLLKLGQDQKHKDSPNA